MTRHMRNARIEEHHVPVREVSRQDWPDAARINTPVAIGFTEGEVVALAKFLGMIDAVSQLDGFTDTSDEAANIVSAANVLTAAAGEIDANEFEPPLHEEDA